MVLATSQQEFSDADFRIVDNGDQSKKLAFELSGITTGTTRTITIPDASGTLVFTSRTISAAGLATGGGDLSANRTITVTAATQSDQETGTSTSVAVVPGVQHFHPGHPKVWVGFDTAGSRSSGFYNVTSVTDSGVGDWTVNFTTSFSSANYAPFVSGGIGLTAMIYNISTKAAGSCRVIGSNTSSATADPTGPALIFFHAYGDQ